ncbi:P-loop containing nucleoside triphosphate hydrolase protein [Mycena floridula]|nr:P-loop containing nucleoside triphosphate hydrolase protein [Mycena floridula]
MVQLRHEVVELHEWRQKLAEDRKLNAKDLATSDPLLPAPPVINYTQDSFSWDEQCTTSLKRFFHLDGFRSCQRGAINAALHGRDVLCLMPTGGGKSLTYQLPALMSSGCTIVISPLKALIEDQIMNLKKLKRMFSTFREVKEITNQLISPIAGREIQLCYVTPEKFQNSPAFQETLRKMHETNRLRRIVVDEAQCVSQMAHYRPAYQALRALRTMFPRVPITGLSATFSPTTRDEFLKTMRLGPIVDGNNAPVSRDTVYFSAPMDRPNLHYQITPKAGLASNIHQWVSTYIMDNHRGKSGIIYCLSQKDAETFAKELRKRTRGGVTSAAYHQDVPADEKRRIHTQWHAGIILVVCATIAFGLGIDKADVRFVIHQSDSVDSYYQESGRGGRDGDDCDCILLYRSQDAVRLSKLMPGDDMKVRRTRLYDMMRFVHSLTECRNILFIKWDSSNSDIRVFRHLSPETQVVKPCRTCDNCTRNPATIETRNSAFEAWQVLRVLRAATSVGHKVTLRILATLARRGYYGQNIHINLDQVCEGKVTLTPDDIERLLVHLLLQKYLEQVFYNQGYGVNAFVKLTQTGARLAGISWARIESNPALVTISLAFLKKAEKQVVRGMKRKQAESVSTTSESLSKRPKRRSTSYVKDESDIEIEGILMASDDDEPVVVVKREPIELMQ